MYQSRNMGNVSIKHSNDFVSEVLSKASMNDFNKERLGDYSSWHIIDPDNGYDFSIRSGRLRDGGSRTIDFYGKNYPKEWEKYSGIIRYNGIGNEEEESKQAQQRRDYLNQIFKAYGLQFDKRGGKLSL